MFHKVALMKNTLKIFSIFILVIIFGCDKSSNSPSVSTSTGQSGSMAAMVMVGDYVYRISDASNLQIYDASSDSSVVLKNTIKIGTGVETIYPHDHYLFFGTQSGMRIYDISNPLSPVFVSNYSHILSCDPVVVKGNYAYVTLRKGSQCIRGQNQLEVIDISDLSFPKLKKTYPTFNPHGLDVIGDRLILCDGDAGIKFFNIANPLLPKIIDSFNTMGTYDVIAAAPIHFIVSARQGVYQFTQKNDSLQMLSLIPASLK